MEGFPGIAITIGIVIGIAAAALAWFSAPASIDRLSLGAWLVGIGFVCGVVWELASRKAR